MAKRAKAAALDAALKTMFRKLEERPVPRAVSWIVDPRAAEPAPLRKAS